MNHRSVKLQSCDGHLPQRPRGLRCAGNPHQHSHFALVVAAQRVGCLTIEVLEPRVPLGGTDGSYRSRTGGHIYLPGGSARASLKRVVHRAVVVVSEVRSRVPPRALRRARCRASARGSTSTPRCTRIRRWACGRWARPPQRRAGGMNAPCRVHPASAECMRLPSVRGVRALPSAPAHTTIRPRGGGTAFHPPLPSTFPARRQARVAGRLPLPASGAYVARSEVPEGSPLKPSGIHPGFALGPSDETGPPHTPDWRR